ncbi:PREDICTED: DNA polymerase epsilon subunit 4, partial [Phaethon lepturus]|uniref:DNA polymerase epsilon subunit 4 n=1 Tax=Phaethon lepturus TaxID=97097 RepID=UPI0005304C86
ELFVETIAKDAYVYAQQGKRKTLQRKDLDNAIEAIDEFAFLEGAGAVGREDEQGNLFAERGCCRRQSHFLHLGHGASGSPVSVDVGKCWSSCLSRRIGSPHPGLPGLSRHSSMLDFLRSKKVRKVVLSGAPTRHCGRQPHVSAGSCCEPARVHVERLLLFEGVRKVEVVDGCHCSTCPKECLRLPALKTFFPDSPWEVTLDVGKCSDLAYSA